MAEKQTNKERLKDITDSIETGIKELFESDKYRQYLATMSRFHKYSVNNTMLIYMQRPDATHVAGFNKWRDQFGRNVKKGEKGIKIIAPTPFKKKIEQQKLDPDTKLPLRDENGDIITEEKTVQIPMYKPVVVFDVQQTAGKPLPELAANLTGDVQNYGVFMEALRRSAPVPIFFEKLAENMDGYFSVDKQRIVLREGMSEVQTVCAAVHEIAHSRLHNKDEIGEKYQEVELFGKPALFSNGRIDRDKLPEGLYVYDLRGSDYDPGMPVTLESHVTVNHAASAITAAPIELPEQGFLYLGEDGLNFTGGEQTVKEFLHAQYPEKAKLSRAAEEIQAESISFAVCAYYGIETGENSFGYLATWAKDRELTELCALLETINRTSSSLITDIDRHYAEICKERGLDKETESLAAQPVQEIAVQEQEPVTAPDNGCVPDPAISVESMNAYGYTDSNMLPLTKERALELMERDVSVYMLHTDNTEAMAFDAEDIRSFDGIFGVEEKAQYEQLQRQTAARSAAWNDYNAVKEAHPDDLVLFQVGDFFELYGEDAKQAAELLEINLTTRNIPGAGRVEMCGVPADRLEEYVESLRDKYDVTISTKGENSPERHTYTLRSVDHEAEAAIDAQEAEFGADGTRVFRDPAAEQVQPTVQELFERYRLSVGNALSKDEAFLNACRNSDRQNAYLEGAATIRRIVTESGDLQLTRLYFDMPAFHNRLHQELLDELYPTLATTVTTSPYKVTQADIDAALQQWNGRIESKHAVVRYMKAHARDRDTAAWLAREYGLKDTSKPLQISVGNSEPVTLSWAKVQRRIAQLIQSDGFYTEQEQDNFDNIDPIAIREALAERGIVNGQIVDAEANRNSPFVRQVMADVERIAAQERKAQQEEPAFDPADRFHAVSLDRGFRTLYAVWDDETHGYHVDADGVTEEFTSEWQAEAYRLELQGQAEQALLERAKGLISDFCRSEYGSEADFSDPAKVGVAYTTVTDDEIPIQVNIDLVNFRLERYLDDEHLETRQYGSLQELISNELENLDFSDLIHVSDEDVDQYLWREPEEAVAEAPETAPAPQREPFPYSVGDTVYLENGKPYIIESVGVFDITLSDPTLFYPISRAESRESFARLMERYPQPEKTAAENTAVPEKEPKPAYTEETVAVYPGDKNNLPYDVEIRTLRFDEPEHDPPAPLPPAENFRITDDNLGVGGAKAKFRANMAAIHLLKELEFEGLQASPEQQEILSRYVGWGGLQFNHKEVIHAGKADKTWRKSKT